MSYTDHHPAASPFIRRVVHKLYTGQPHLRIKHGGETAGVKQIEID
jgi:hypothetical protein